ncbi:MAG TPA: UDP-N-acetylmuramoyl-L-alanine--D-glutamate ligase [Rubricoccaceae bacterium]|nr:UDP-N-acetylmuramoyl-L-alanine--D-glutamate ligase [Rubricoccaceae bacterium]
MNPSDLKGKHVTVVGGARSGLAAARLLARYGARVFLTEQGPADERLAERLEDAGVRYEFGGHTRRALEADLFVLSPGVPSTIPLIQQALRQRIPVYSEVEVASWLCRGPIVAVTGSNGKTTTTSLVAHLFRTAHRDHVVAGNIGYPFADYVEQVGEKTAVVLEVSSFQLDHTATFRPRVAVLLNITPDHLDRYDHDFNQYAQSKFRVFANQQPGDWLVYNEDDELVRDYVAMAAAKRGLVPYGFSIERELERGAFVRWDTSGNGTIVLALPTATLPHGALDPQSPVIHPEELMPTSDLALRGRHNLYNSLAAAIAARAMEIQSDVVRQSLTSFEGVPHRLEKVRSLHDVAFVNDSKATNVNAVWYALESFPGNVILIAGGRDKGNDYGPLKPLVAEKVKGLVALGESGDKVLAELGPHTAQTARAHTMEEAIQFARLMAEPGDTVLLSPACASFDMFENYEDRGDTFKRLVMSL